MLACEIDGGVREYLFVGHRSAEKSQETACARMGIQPLLDLGLRLGEGSGAALAMDTIRSAVALLTGMASFEEARISRKK
jgi:nicotinate-nucleotide--dimethylbenzimidazole phosphoribosyltransferase